MVVNKIFINISRKFIRTAVWCMKKNDKIVKTDKGVALAVY